MKLNIQKFRAPFSLLLFLAGIGVYQNCSPLKPLVGRVSPLSVDCNAHPSDPACRTIPSATPFPSATHGRASCDGFDYVWCENWYTNDSLQGDPVTSFSTADEGYYRDFPTGVPDPQYLMSSSQQLFSVKLSKKVIIPETGYHSFSVQSDDRVLYTVTNLDGSNQTITISDGTTTGVSAQQIQPVNAGTYLVRIEWKETAATQNGSRAFINMSKITAVPTPSASPSPSATTSPSPSASAPPVATSTKVWFDITYHDAFSNGTSTNCAGDISSAYMDTGNAFHGANLIDSGLQTTLTDNDRGGWLAICANTASANPAKFVQALDPAPPAACPSGYTSRGAIHENTSGVAYADGAAVVSAGWLTLCLRDSDADLVSLVSGFSSESDFGMNNPGCYLGGMFSVGVNSIDKVRTSSGSENTSGYAAFCVKNNSNSVAAPMNLMASPGTSGTSPAVLSWSASATTGATYRILLIKGMDAAAYVMTTSNPTYSTQSSLGSSDYTWFVGAKVTSGSVQGITISPPKVFTR